MEEDRLNLAFQVKRAIGWLRVRDKDKETAEHTKYAATLILKHMAQNSPAVFNVHVKSFIDVIWNALRSPNREIRESAVESLSVRPGYPSIFLLHQSSHLGS